MSKTISEKLVEIAENEQKVYDAGYAEGLKNGGGGTGDGDGSYDEGYNAGYNVGKNDGYTEGKTDGYNEGYEDGERDGNTTGYGDGYNVGFVTGKEEGITTGKAEGIEIGRAEGYVTGKEEGKVEGKQAEREAFWDILQNYGNRTNYNYAFAYGHWKDEIYNPKYPIKVNNCNGLFIQTDITDTKVPIDFTTFSDNQAQIFSYADLMKTIQKVIVTNQTQYSGWFTSCSALENITFEGEIGNNVDLKSSTKLSADSIRSIIEHLSDANPPAGQPKKTLTLSRAAVEKMDISDVHVSTTGPFATTGGTFLPTCEVPMRAGERIKVTLDVAEGHHYNDFYSDAQPDWAVGFSFNGNEPYNIEETYTAETDGTVYIGAYIMTRKACEFTFKIRAVFVDADGNETDGENQFSIADGDYSYEDRETGAITNYTVKSDWAALEASKPNWNISLV